MLRHRKLQNSKRLAGKKEFEGRQLNKTQKCIMCFRKLQYNLLQKHLLFETNMLQNNNIIDFQARCIFCILSGFALSLTPSIEPLYHASRLSNCPRLSEPGSKIESKYIKISDIKRLITCCLTKQEPGLSDCFKLDCLS